MPVTNDSYTLAIVLGNTNARHFRLLLRSILNQSRLPAEVLYVGLPMTGSAVAHHASRRPLALDVEQRLLWCPIADSDEPMVNWSILETVAYSAQTGSVLITSSDVVAHRDFAGALLDLAGTTAIATSFPVVLSPALSDRLDEPAIDAGEPFASWWRVLMDGIFGQTHRAARIIPSGRLGAALDRLSLGRQLSSSALAMTRQTLDQLLSVRHHGNSSSRLPALLASAGIRYQCATRHARHARLAETRPQIFALAPITESQWSTPPLGVLDVRPVLHRHRLN